MPTLSIVEAEQSVKVVVNSLNVNISKVTIYSP